MITQFHCNLSIASTFELGLSERKAAGSLVAWQTL
jgi:hypothetical protein